MNYRLLMVAEAELAEAAIWYETQASGLGQQFLDEFEATMDAKSVKIFDRHP